MTPILTPEQKAKALDLYDLMIARAPFQMDFPGAGPGMMHRPPTE